MMCPAVRRKRLRTTDGASDLGRKAKKHIKRGRLPYLQPECLFLSLHDILALRYLLTNHDEQRESVHSDDARPATCKSNAERLERRDVIGAPPLCDEGAMMMRRAL